jgi:hypothetical protein
MQTTANFPPADALIQQLSKVDYHKLLKQFVTIILTIAAVVYVLTEKFVQWYQQGGKDATIQTLTKVWNFLQICYVWCRTEGYPQLIKFARKVTETYRAWQDLVTV